MAMNALSLATWLLPLELSMELDYSYLTPPTSDFKFLRGRGRVNLSLKTVNSSRRRTLNTGPQLGAARTG